MFSFFFNLVEKNVLRVKKCFKCCENGIASLRKRKLQWRQVDVRSVDGLELSSGCSLRFGNSSGAYVVVIRYSSGACVLVIREDSEALRVPVFSLFVKIRKLFGCLCSGYSLPFGNSSGACVLVSR